MDMLNVGESSSAIKNLNPFSMGFGRDQLATGLLSLHRWRVLTTRQLADVTGFSYHHVTGNFKRSSIRHGLIKPVPSRFHDYSSGRPPAMFALEKTGYDALAEAVLEHWHVDDAQAILGAFRPPPRSCRWGTGKPHAYAIIDAAIAIEKAARCLAGVEVAAIIPEFTPWDGFANPTFQYLPNGRGLRADMAVILRAGNSTWVVFVEIDRATEKQTRSDAERIYQTIEGKAKLYWSYLQSGLFAKRYGVTAPAFQVLFVTTSDQRAANMAANIGSSGLLPIGMVRPDDVFSFTTMAEAKADFFGPIWRGIDGQRRSAVGGGS